MVQRPGLWIGVCWHSQSTVLPVYKLVCLSLGSSNVDLVALSVWPFLSFTLRLMDPSNYYRIRSWYWGLVFNGTNLSCFIFRYLYSKLELSRKSTSGPLAARNISLVSSKEANILTFTIVKQLSIMMLHWAFTSAYKLIFHNTFRYIKQIKISSSWMHNNAAFEWEVNCYNETCLNPIALQLFRKTK